MMNNNKILTVSYGTFSCTLEGFDDSFDTMKAIAEYFRDLAADDRYFGAEPPQPDAEMLARIAEREVARRVEAREHDGRIMLKAHDEVVEEAVEPPKTAAVTTAAVAAVPEAEAVEDIVSNEATTPEPVADPETAFVAEEAPCAEISPETPVIEDIVEEEPAETAVEETEPAVDASAFDVAEPAAETAEVTPAADEAAPVEAVAAPTAQDDFAEEIVAQDVALSAEAFFADSPSIDDIEDDVEMEGEAIEPFDSFVAEPEFVAPPAATADASDSIAAKLQRIREVVSQHDDEAEDVEYEEDIVEAEDQHASDFLDAAFETEASDSVHDEDTTLADAAEDIESALDADDQIAAEAEEPQDEAEDELSGILSRLEAGDAQSDALEEEDTLIGADDDDVIADEAGENLFDDDDHLEEDHLDADDHEEPTAEVEEAIAAQEEDDDLPVAPVQGRVMKVDRAELEAALDSGELEEFDGSDAPELSDEDEAELQRELDAVAAEAGSDDTDAQATRPSLPAIDADASEDVSRLMAEADSQMEEPEGATRRSAFAHLRAAVAARFADKTMREEPTEEETTKAYRSDLAEVVKPRRPVASGNRTERPAEARPTPLKLVAEQRIDVDGAGNNAPVTPRRVAAAFDDDFDMDEDTGFADFAEEMGATKLPELLEAAAAYLSFVEGHEQFSRPQLMTRVRQVDCGEFSREDGLRSFGQLLRAGKIEKIKGGRFTASEAIGFKPDERAAG
ncbi:hypothetical protein [uncultured Roseobacter sp.]|uniref:hypothetical protein n=1 Tax=uncultured Roseobacter sp. TaxID=114847 RepID=UPI00262A7985|nr:hypothetical protein [uncultured Roseobacter sp.]